MIVIFFVFADEVNAYEVRCTGSKRQMIWNSDS